MNQIYKTPEGQRMVEDRYRQLLKYWPAANRQFHVPTCQGDTFVIASGEETAPPLVLIHGSAANSASWMGEVASWAKRFRVYAIDVIGEPGLSSPSRPAMNSDSYARWLDDVFRALGLERASLVGTSLGGWLALDYATRRPGRVQSLVLISPGGIGRQKMGILFKVAFFKLFGSWGTRKLRDTILGRPAGNPSPAMQEFIEFVALIHQSFRPRMGRIPVFDDAALRGLTMPVLAIVGEKDVLLDSRETKRRLSMASKNAEVSWLAGVGHLVVGQGTTVQEFLERGLSSVEPAPLPAQ